MCAFHLAKQHIIAALALTALIVPTHANDKAASSADIETALVPLVSFKGEEGNRLTLNERREALRVKAASVAVMRGGEIAWARAYGEGVDQDTLFQLASLSKTVAAAGIVALAFEKGVSLDEDISGSLTGLDL
ncbi:MAG: serine hydrolase domain-containing protein, partial [Pseudomonadota bacterium]